MNFFRKYIISVRPAINIVLLVAVLSIVIIDAWLKSIPELLSWGYEVGIIYYKICISVISSYIFYFIVIHLKAVKDKENINAFLFGKVKSIINQYHSQIGDLKNASGISSDDVYLEKEEIKKILLEINPASDAPMVYGVTGKYINWVQYLHNSKIVTDKLIEKIFKKMPFLDSELVSILAKIDDCGHFVFLEIAIKISMNNPDMSVFTSGFYEYGKLCQLLENYSQRVLFEYT